LPSSSLTEKDVGKFGMEKAGEALLEDESDIVSGSKKNKMNKQGLVGGTSRGVGLYKL
jgi:hypothetical protein